MADESGLVQAEGSQLLKAGMHGSRQQHRAPALWLGSLSPAFLQQLYDLGCTAPRTSQALQATTQQGRQLQGEFSCPSFYSPTGILTARHSSEH